MSVSTSEVALSILTNPELNVDRIAPRPAPAPSAAEAPVTGGFLSRTHILEATEACLAEVGYDGTTIRAIAGRLGCAVGSIYRYFDDKNALLLACASRIVEPVVREVSGGVSIEQSVRHYIRQARAHAEMHRLLMWLGGRVGTAKVVSDLIAGWSRLLGSEAAAQTCWATVHGLVLLGAAESAIVEAALRPASSIAAESSVTVDIAAAPAAVVTAASPDDVTLL